MRVVFLTSHPDGQAAFDFLQICPNADIVYSQFSGKVKSLPPYSIGISFFYNYLVPADEISPPRLWVNFHPAPLPEYRGRNVAYHAILNGETEFGATLHYVDRDFDTGDIIKVSRFPILPHHTAGDIAKLARQKCLELFCDYVPTLLTGQRLPSYKQMGGTYYRKEPINPYINLTPDLQKSVRAITADPYFAKTVIGGVEYELRPVHSPASIMYHPHDESPQVATTDPNQTV